MNVELGNSIVGILNLGEMWSGSIAASISTLTAPSQYGNTGVFANSTESSKASRNISLQKQTERLDPFEVNESVNLIDVSETAILVVFPTVATMAILNVSIILTKPCSA